MSSNYAVAQVLELAARNIERYGWKAEGADIDDNDPEGDYPRCVWIAGIRANEQLDNPVPTYDWECFLNESAGVDSIEELFRLNDSMSDEEGPQWAVKTLRRAAFLAAGTVPVPSENPKVSPLTVPTESGNTPSAESRVKQLLRKLRLVK